MSLAQWIASLGGVGRLPAPGTMASAVTVVALWLIRPLPLASQAAVIVATTLLGWWAAQACITANPSVPDPSYVVIDEVAGMLVACFLVPKSPLYVGAAFAAFRVLDIAKPWPLRRLERLPGGWGIMADDLAAGLLARGCVAVLERIAA